MTTANRHELAATLRRKVRNLELSQEQVEQRFQEIRGGSLSRDRSPTKTVLLRRDTTRDELRRFLDCFTPDEVATLAILWGDRHWRIGYDSLLDPTNDPQL